MGDYYRVASQKKQSKAASRMLRFKRDHTSSFSSTGKKCGCGHNHNSINILDESDGHIIERDVCPFMYGVRNSCLRAIFGRHIPKIDMSLLQDVSHGD